MLGECIDAWCEVRRSEHELANEEEEEEEQGYLL